MPAQFTFPIRSADIWGLNENEKRNDEDVAADLDYQDRAVEDYLNKVVPGVPATYQPVIDQAGTVTYSASSVNWVRMGLLNFVDLVLVVTGTGSAGSIISISLPTPCVASSALLGDGFISDVSAVQSHFGFAYPNSTTTAKILDTTTTGEMGVNPNFGLGNGDLVRLHLCYVGT